MKGVVAAFQACLLTRSSWQDVSGTYRFRLRVPPRPSPRSILQIRVVDAGSTPGAPPVIARSSDGGVDVRLAVHATPGKKLVGREAGAREVDRNRPGRPRPRPLRAPARASRDGPGLGNAYGATHAMAPCPRSREFGTFDGDDVPGVAVAHFRSPAAALGLHVLRPERHGSTCPAVNRLGCYEIPFRVERAGRV